MNDLIFINNLEDNQLHGAHRTAGTPSSPSAKAEGAAPDTYDSAAASCSVRAVDSGSTFGFWKLIFKLFAPD